jgi:hypothetical protein
MTRVYEPKPFPPQTQRNSNNFPTLREITDENFYEERPDAKSHDLNTADDWMKMHLEGKMEENY